MPTTLTNSRPPLQIRPFEAADWPALRALLEPVFRAGETFPHDSASQAWVEQSQAVMVAVEPAGAVLGTYYLRPNSLALGAHVGNSGYVAAGVLGNEVQPGGEPAAFRHRQLGYVDALVMFQGLAEGPTS
ncbi:hypothetical protein [Cyanobium sp. BA20m-14]|uniref:hypothetical protein n=1 Tax=Cyanobium sp. BA20m-14 TaxID=2823703 RepID=UPI0020CFE4EE|nr:hypothetical protein [Cyanobium sp. BA20m-14]